MPSACLAVDEIPFCFAETIVGGFLQGFAEKLFSRLQKCNERFEVGRILLAAFFSFKKPICNSRGNHYLLVLASC
jgi:hypothetical protein